MMQTLLDIYIGLLWIIMNGLITIDLKQSLDYFKLIVMMTIIISTLDEKLLKVQKPINSLLKNQLIKVEMVQLRILQYQRQNIDLEAFLTMVSISLRLNINSLYDSV